MTPANDNRPAAFDAAVMALKPRLESLARRYEHNKQDREDLVQDTIVLALSRWSSYDGVSSLLGWIAFRMRHIIQNRRRRLSLDTTDIDDNIGASRPTQESGLDLSQTLAALPERTAKVLTAVGVGYTFVECGVAFNLSEARIRAITKDGRTALRKVAA